jgi:hypothetical protein
MDKPLIPLESSLEMTPAISWHFWDVSVQAAANELPSSCSFS